MITLVALDLSAFSRFFARIEFFVIKILQTGGDAFEEISTV